MSSPPRTPNRPRIAIRFRAMHHHDSRTSARRRHARTRALARPHKSSIRSSHVAPAILPRVHAESITNRNTLRLGLGEHGERAVRSVLAPKGASSTTRSRPCLPCDDDPKSARSARGLSAAGGITISSASAGAGWRRPSVSADARDVGPMGLGHPPLCARVCRVNARRNAVRCVARGV
jgi:hypothetical protein